MATDSQHPQQQSDQAQPTADATEPAALPSAIAQWGQGTGVPVTVVDPTTGETLYVEWDGRLENNPLAKLCGFQVDALVLGPTPAHGNLFPIMSYQVVPVAGSTPSVCDKAEPRLPAEFLTQVERRFRELGMLQDGKTIHWVGDQRRPETVCTCGLPAAAKKDVKARRAEWMARAMILVRDHPDRSDREIAKTAGVDPSQLSRCREYQAAASLARGQKTDRRPGYLTRNEDGQTDVEGVAE